MHNTTTHATCRNCPSLDPKKTLVVKVDHLSTKDLPALCQDAAYVVAQGHDLILIWDENLGSSDNPVHGNRPHLLIENRHELEGLTNVQIVSNLQRLGVNAIGLNGLDGKIIQTRFNPTQPFQTYGNGKPATENDGAEIEGVNMGLLCLLVGSGYTPVIKPLGLDPNGLVVQVNGDQASASIAVAIRADVLLILTGLPDVTEPKARKTHAVGDQNSWEVATLVLPRKRQVSQKVLTAKEQLKGNLKEIILSNGLSPNPISEPLWGHRNPVQINGIKANIRPWFEPACEQV